jgi:hypothetical protein
LICTRPPPGGNRKRTISNFRRRLPITKGSRLAITKRIVAAALCAAVLGIQAPASAADLPHRAHVRHAWLSQTYDWRDRCAYAGYYCLYAEYGYAYHYPFDDRPVARAYYRHRYR